MGPVSAKLRLIRWRLIPFGANLGPKLLNESSTKLDSPLLTSAIDEASNEAAPIMKIN